MIITHFDNIVLSTSNRLRQGDTEKLEFVQHNLKALNDRNLFGILGFVVLILEILGCWNLRLPQFFSLWGRYTKTIYIIQLRTKPIKLRLILEKKIIRKALKGNY